MYNLFKFLFFVAVLSAGIGTLFRLTESDALAQAGDQDRQTQTPEQATLATKPLLSGGSVDVLAAVNEQTKRLVNEVVPSVVTITSTASPAARPMRGQIPDEFYRYFFGGRPPAQQPMFRALGSGFVVSSEGHILTNFHVINGADRVEVAFSDGRETTARLIGGDERLDIAVLKVDSPGVKPLPLGDSDDAQPGEIVYAVGNPFGLMETVTDGIISAKSRTASDGLVEFIQTNAVINQGNSGGPLLNIRGEVIGINTQIIANMAGSWQGYGFAIPSNTAKRALDQILSGGRVQQGYLGVNIGDVEDLPESQRVQFGIQAKSGAIIAAVRPNSPAASAGLKEYDVVVAFEGQPINDSGSLVRAVSNAAPGTEVTLTVERAGRTMEMKVLLGDYALSNQSASLNPALRSPAPRAAPERRPA